MKTLLAALLVLSGAASLGSAQDLSSMLQDVPDCALPCVIDGLQTGNCTAVDVPGIANCVCPDVSLLSSLAICVQTSCILEEQARAALLLQDMCADFPKEDRRTTVKVTAIVCLALTTVIVLLRCIARLTVSSRLWWDDLTILMAAVCLIGMTSLKIVGSDLGFGLHFWDVNPQHAPTIFQIFYTTQLLYIVIQVTAKVSILVLFSRIFSATWLQRSVKICSAFLITHGLVFLMVIIFQCNPVHGAWNKGIHSKCLNLAAVSYVGAVLSIIEDVVILALPVPEVLKLQLTTQKKVAVCLMFSVGSFACVTSMVRLKFVVTFSSGFDSSWDNVDIVIWSIIEETCAIICGSLPTLRPLLQKVPGLMSSARASAFKSGDGSNRRSVHTGKSSTGANAPPAAGSGPFSKLTDSSWDAESAMERRAGTKGQGNMSTMDSAGMNSMEEFEMQTPRGEKARARLGM